MYIQTNWLNSCKSNKLTALDFRRGLAACLVISSLVGKTVATQKWLLNIILIYRH